jgi:hypothetical protein
VSTKHKDGSEGVWGCDRFDSRAACPACIAYEASNDIEHAMAVLRGLPEVHETHALVESLMADLRSVDQRLFGLETKIRAGLAKQREVV